MTGRSIPRIRGRYMLAVTAVATLAASLVVALNPFIAEAVDQTAKNGCTSPDVFGGQLISPPFTSNSETGNVSFQGWFEGESVSPGGFDEVTVAYSIGGGTPVPFGDLKTVPGTPPNSGGSSDVGYSNMGTGVKPANQLYNFTLPSAALDTSGVRIHFQFTTGDTSFNGFRGFGVDSVSIDTFSSPLTEGFEASSPGWAFDPPAGAGAPAWHTVANPETISIKSPEINPDLVTLGAGDDGALPPAPTGSHIAWFGADTSGTFCGPDFGNRVVTDTVAPDTTITGGPSGSTSETSASFTFASSEPGSTFQCRVGGGAFAACSSPFSVSGLSVGAHSFEVRATDAAGNVDPTPAARAWTVDELTLADLPKPTLGEEVNVQALSGVVLIGVRTGAAAGAGARASQRGVRFVPLTAARQIPVGSVLDTKKGKVRLQSARNKSGKRQNGDFSGGRFKVLQSKKRKDKGLTEARLTGGNFKSCKGAKKSAVSADVEARASARRIRRLSGSANGRYRTGGRRSAATVRGTKWTVTDRCDGTLTKVTKGTVVVRDFGRKKNIIVRKGKSYLARNPR